MAGDGAEVKEALVVKELRAEKFGLATTPSATGTSFTITNWNSDVALDCDSTTAAELADVLGTLINELITKGIIGGSVAGA